MQDLGNRSFALGMHLTTEVRSAVLGTIVSCGLSRSVKAPSFVFLTWFGFFKLIRFVSRLP